MITVLLRPEDLAGDGVAHDLVAHDLVAHDLVAHDRVEIEGNAYRHLFRARRLETGSRLRAVDGKGRARWAEVVRVERRLATLSLGAPAPANEPEYRLHLWVAALRAERASWLVEKATEIGVYSIRFVTTERTPRKYAAASLERLRRVARAAVEQCHRSRVPEISGVEPWEVLTASLGETGRAGADRYVLDLDARRRESGLSSKQQGMFGSSEHALQRRGWANDSEPQAQGRWGLVLVGPEGGWSGTEKRQLRKLDCRAVSLGHRTLRVETAAIAAAAKLLL